TFCLVAGRLVAYSDRRYNGLACMGGAVSIWHKPIDQITFDDVKVFCTETPQREGIRLDYKAEIPKHLDKLLCAFANTLGGMIILGVEGNNANEPVWPPKGMSDTKGISERITQIGAEAVYPPVRPHI